MGELEGEGESAIKIMLCTTYSPCNIYNEESERVGMWESWRAGVRAQ